MATVIDELIVRLGLDSSSFKTSAATTQASIGQVSRTAVASGKGLEDTLKKTQDATDRRLKQTADVGRSSSQQFRRFRGEVAALFTTLATGFGLQAFVKGIANTEAATGRLATNIGMSTGELNAWQEAAKRNGGTAEATGSSFLGLANQFQQFALTGQSAVIPYFRALGISMSDAHGEMRPMRDIMLDLADKFSKMTPQRANAFGAAIGLDQGTITLLRSGREAVLAYLAEAQKIGVISDQDAAAGIKFEQSLARFEQSIRNLGRAIGNDLMPVFEEWMDDVTQWLSDPANQEFIQQTVYDDIKKFTEVVRNVIATIKEWHGVAEALALYIGGRWLLSMTLGLGPVGIAVATIAAGFVALQQVPRFFDPGEWSNNSPFWIGMSKEKQLQYPNSPESRKARGESEVDPNERSLFHPSTWFGDHTLRGGATDARKATVRDRLAADLGISKEAASGIVQPLNAESNLAGINEKNPMVPGSRGGFGWAQWTGPRRQAFEAYAASKGLQPASDEANYGFLVEELRTKYPQVLEQLRRGSISATDAANIVTRQYIVPGVPGQSDFETKVARHVNGAEDIAKIRSDNPGGTEGLRKGLPTAITDSNIGNWLFGAAQRDATIQGGRGPRANESNAPQTNINGPITIHTQATDADGIARSLDSSLKKYSYVAQSNTGLV